MKRAHAHGPRLEPHQLRAAEEEKAGDRRERRRQLLRMGSAARRLSSRIAVHLCGVCRSEQVELWAAEGGQARATNLRRCSSPWECPECAQRIGLRRREELQRLAERHRAAGGELYHLILTAQHSRGTDLKAMRRQISTAWQRCISGAPWLRWKKRHQINGVVRALDVTYGRHGWHPHLHVLLLTDAPVPPRDLVRLRRFFFDRWCRALGKLGTDSCAMQPPRSDSMITRGRGVRLRVAVVAEYLAEASIMWADELGSHTMKQARGRNSTPWQILQRITRGHYPTQGERNADRSIWRAWATEIRGARQLTWSRGLRNRYRVEQDDSQTELDLAPPECHRLTVSAYDWRYVIRQDPALNAAVYDLAEDFALSPAEAQLVLDSWILQVRARPSPHPQVA